jgi:hypothetical protein
VTKKDSLSRRIAARLAQTPPATSGGSWKTNFATLMVLKGEIQAALNDGWIMKSVFEQLLEEGSFSGSYQAFWRTWKKVTRADDRAADRDRQEAGTPEEKTPEKRDGPVIVREPPSKQFSFNNMPKR